MLVERITDTVPVVVAATIFPTDLIRLRTDAVDAVMILPVERNAETVDDVVTVMVRRNTLMAFANAVEVVESVTNLLVDRMMLRIPEVDEVISLATLRTIAAIEVVVAVTSLPGDLVTETIEDVVAANVLRTNLVTDSEDVVDVTTPLPTARSRLKILVVVMVNNLTTVLGVRTDTIPVVESERFLLIDLMIFRTDVVLAETIFPMTRSTPGTVVTVVVRNNVLPNPRRTLTFEVVAVATLLLTALTMLSIEVVVAETVLPVRRASDTTELAAAVTSRRITLGVETVT